MIRPAPILIALCLLACRVQAQDVRRCQQSDGSIVITDGMCSAEAVEKSTTPEPILRTPGLPRRAGITPPPACNPSPEDLQYSIRLAIDRRDVNQLAKHYHWPDVSDTQAEALMNRLEKLVSQPILDIQLQYPVSAEPDLGELDYQSPDDTASRPSPLPYGLKVLQYRSSTDVTVQTTHFRLQRHFNCWWIRY